MKNVVEVNYYFPVNERPLFFDSFHVSRYPQPRTNEGKRLKKNCNYLNKIDTRHHGGAKLTVS